MFTAAINEILKRPERYYIPSGQTDTRSMEVTSNGNGFLVSPDGHIVTSAHLVKPSKDDLKLMMAEEAATSAVVDELDALESGLGFKLTSDEADSFMAAGLSIYADYLTVSDAKSKTQVYPGNMISKARDEEKGLTTETIKVGDKVTALGYLSSKSSESSSSSIAPNKDKPTLVTGTVASHRKMEGGWDVIQMQIPLKEGSSGSPIFNSNGDVVGVETFGTVEQDQDTGAKTNVETEDFAIPVSVVKDFMSQTNVNASEGTLTKTYREGVDLFHEQHYSAAKKKFEEIKSSNPDFPFIQDYISESQSNIDKGLDLGTFPTWIIIVGLIAIVVVAVILVLALVVIPKSRKKSSGAVAGDEVVKTSLLHRLVQVDLQDPLADGVTHQFVPLVQVELLHDVGFMGLHCFDADEQGFGDLAAGVTLGQQLENLALAAGQRIEAGGRLLPTPQLVQ